MYRNQHLHEAYLSPMDSLWVRCLTKTLIFALRGLSLGPLGRGLGNQGSRMPGLDLVHDVKHLLRGHAELSGRSVVWVTFPARRPTIDCSNSLLIFYLFFYSGSSCWKYNTSKNPNTISTTSPKDSSFVVWPRSSLVKHNPANRPQIRKKRFLGSGVAQNSQKPLRTPNTPA